MKSSDSVHDISVVFLSINNGKESKASVHTGRKIMFTKRNNVSFFPCLEGCLNREYS